ncbi:MAG: glycogen debranching enzyme N-terminal domain-containing protein, partial [Candidatus Promineifilaceae bacterium]|nr:glycogen debranching enzyme N-terminal domain-containing protein [Candidatus Promineifilaceae bacterium]
MLEFGREVCGDTVAAESREWLVTNGIGGFAMGTLAGPLTRRYHGLLVAALKPPLARTLLLAKLDETASYLGKSYPLFSNRWADGTLEPAGFHYLERFHLEGAIPVWSYALADALLEKRIWMEQGVNTTYVHYRLARGSAPLTLAIKALANYRDYHHTTAPEAWSMEVTTTADGLRLQADPATEPFYLLSQEAAFKAQEEWYTDYYLPVEAYRGQDDEVDAHVLAGLLDFDLQPGHSLTVVASTTAAADLDGTAALRRRRDYERGLLEQAQVIRQPGPIQQLVLAADQFIVRRATDQEADGRSIIAGYPWFSDWGRDTMIALSGLTLQTGRLNEAAKILRTFARFVDQGMLPNRFPDLGEAPEYNTVDATLWYFEAIRAYLAARQDNALLVELFPVLQEIVEWHRRGTRYNIRMDPGDGLIYAGQTGVQLTWMDAK